jgi:hypothetical protein
VIADIFGMLSNSWYSVMSIYIFAGLHMGATQGVLGAIIARSAPQHLIGTAFAIFYGVEGAVLLCANSFAGMMHGIAKYVGLPEASGPFIMGAAASIAEILYTLAVSDRIEHTHSRLDTNCR